MRKLDIVEIALENLKNATAIEGIYIAEEILLGNIKFDGIVKENLVSAASNILIYRLKPVQRKLFYRIIIISFSNYN